MTLGELQRLAQWSRVGAGGVIRINRAGVPASADVARIRLQATLRIDRKRTRPRRVAYGDVRLCVADPRLLGVTGWVCRLNALFALKPTVRWVWP